ncbi:uncharacterized protein LOC144288028 isoform X2 [Canis aureus]
MRLKKEESYWLKPSVATTGRYLLPPEARTLSSPGTQSTTRISPWQFMVFADPATAGRWHDGHIPTAAGSSTQATGTVTEGVENHRHTTQAEQRSPPKAELRLPFSARLSFASPRQV